MDYFINSKSLFVLFAIVCLIPLSCTEDRIDNNDGLDYELENLLNSRGKEFYILPDSDDFDKIPADAKNHLSKEKVALGKFLFFETGLAMDAKEESGKGTYSCASCHIPEMGFRPGFVQGIADGGMGYAGHREMNPEYNEDDLDAQEARPLSLINVAFVKNTSWSGQFGAGGANIDTESVWDDREDTKRNYLGYEGLETQNFQGVTTHRMLINRYLATLYGYAGMFDEAFPEYEESRRISKTTGSLAISAYLRTVISNEAPFQDWLKGDSGAMSEAEKRGAILFFGKAACNRCHNDKNLGSGEFHALGVNDMDQNPRSLKANNPIARRNLGRGGFTLDPEDNYKFKVPGIYNMSDTEFYFHGSSITSLDDLIDYKAAAQSENPRVSQELVSKKFVPLSLSPSEKGDLKTFLKKSLRDPDLDRYKPNDVKSGFCFPNNDDISQSYLNCN